MRRDISDRRGLVNVLTDITQFSLVLGRTDGVGDALREALEIVRRTENTLGLALVIQAAAAFAFAGNAPETAARLTGFADAAFASLGFGRETVTKSLRETLLTNLRASLAAERLGDLLAAGRAARFHRGRRACGATRDAEGYAVALDRRGFAAIVGAREPAVIGGELAAHDAVVHVGELLCDGALRAVAHDAVIDRAHEL